MTYPAVPDSTPDMAFIAQHLFTAILWVNDELTITWVNAQAEQLLAISRGRLLHHSILTLLAPEELSKKKEAKLTNSDLNGGTNASSHQICSLSERFVQACQSQQPFIDHNHVVNLQPSRDMAILIDYSVTPVVYQQQDYFIVEMWGKDRQSRISEEQRQQQQYDVARHMLRSVAHEVKNPLAGIRGAAQLLERQFAKFSALNDLQPDNNLTTLALTTIATAPNVRTMAQKLRSYTGIIISETDRLTQLIGQLLGPTQLPNWQKVNIHEPLEQVLTLILSQYPQIALQRDYDLSLPELDADKDQLIQVFLNLMNNACEAMAEYPQPNDNDHNNELNTTKLINSTQLDDVYRKRHKPQLHIQTRVVFQHTIDSHQHKQVLQITITDNGSGIDPALIGQIFFPMVTNRAAGTGLGLSIVQDIISRHHGMIDVSSNCQQNYSQTQFRVYLPFTQPVPTP